METKGLEVRKPRAGECWQVHPNQHYRKLVTLALDDNGDYYLVAPHLAEELRKKRPDGVRLYMLCLACNSDGENFLWPQLAENIA
jgi:hypothetical protein